MSMSSPARSPRSPNKMITKALDQIRHQKFCKLTGLICHIAYWAIFGQYNKIPLDESFKQILFVEVSKIQSSIASQYQGSYLYTSLVMPILLLSLRIEVDAIFRYCYPDFFAIEDYADHALILLMDVISRLLDPNLFMSKFSFFESDKGPINLNKPNQKGGRGLPALKAKYNTRSPLMKALVPNPSEGTCRIRFMSYKGKEKLQPPTVTSLMKKVRPARRLDTTSQDSLNKSTMVGRNKARFVSKDKINDPNMSQDEIYSAYRSQPPAQRRINHSLMRRQQEVNLAKKGEMFEIAAKKVNQDFKKRGLDSVFNIL
mmetsp:Transcript_26323/g.26239  ORF Transcript_26323/g.26239 Transcript_26323/m.26239 type:complete len:315 (+) Transcript_26323:892-1836(+)